MGIDFEDLFEEKVLKRGYNYYKNGYVHYVTKNSNCYEGSVYGTDIYEDRNFQNEFRSYFAQYFEKAPKRVYERRIEQSIFYAIGRKGFIEYKTKYANRPLMLKELNKIKV